MIETTYGSSNDGKERNLSIVEQLNDSNDDIEY